jgi:hypothetical protein
MRVVGQASSLAPKAKGKRGRLPYGREGIRMPTHDIIVIGASVGGVEVLTQLAAESRC